MKKFLCHILFLTLATSCVSNIEKKGYSFDSSDQQLLQEGVTSKESTLKMMGSPTIISDLSDEENWIYYSEEVKNLLFFIPKVTKREILLVKFDDSNTIKKIEKFDLANEKSKTKFNPTYTEVKSHETGFFKSIFSNIGKVKPQ
ncbi:MAG: outer membrane protein assembly factor BamE [Rickettsiales bacterium]|nr:outer membrane protein assembly factor BamE [Rickettsiales bacterium]